MINNIEQLRGFIAEPADSPVWTDDKLQEYLDSYGTPKAAAHYVWLEKAAEYSRLVDISEGSSSRKMSGLYANAMTQANFYAAYLPVSDLPGAAISAPRTRAIVRP